MPIYPKKPTIAYSIITLLCKKMLDPEILSLIQEMFEMFKSDVQRRPCDKKWAESLTVWR